ncbi:hypothetical protein OAO18_03590 [Francisellaceae bacterium]|nr:hypothetical protein [Francisellaceae bacterium]
MTVAIFSFFGILIGAALQYIFTRHLDSKKHHRGLQTNAYIDYLRCVSEHANLRINRDTDAGKHLGAKTADAKCRICLYGSRNTIEAFAKFEKLGANMNTKEQCLSFTSMVSIMRHDSGTKDKANLSDLETVLLGYQEKRKSNN